MFLVLLRGFISCCAVEPSALLRSGHVPHHMAAPHRGSLSIRRSSLWLLRVKRRSQKSAPAWHAAFLKMLPAIVRHAKIAFRHLRGEARGEAIQKVLCNACAAIARLAELGKLDLCYASVLARFAIAQTRDGRMLGRPLNCKDVASKYCQRAKSRPRTARQVRWRRGLLAGGGASDVAENPWQNREAWQTLLIMSQDRGRLVRPPYLGVKLMKCVIHRRKSYPDNVGHWRCSIALAVLLGKVSERLLIKEPTSTFGKAKPHSR